VWFWHLDADAKLSGAIRPATATTSPIAGKSAKETVKTIAQGVPDRFGVPVVTTLVCFFCLHTRLRVRRAPGIPCALSAQTLAFVATLRDLSPAALGRIRVAGMRRRALSGVIAGASEAIQNFSPCHDRACPGDPRLFSG
jgi:hypothetical protein